MKMQYVLFNIMLQCNTVILFLFPDFMATLYKERGGPSVVGFRQKGGMIWLLKGF